jgi:putative nucleotidyltransferase with HDIG domain
VTNTFVSFPRHAQIFIATIVCFGLFVIGQSVYALYSLPVASQWFLLAALTLLSGSITVKVPSIPATISVSETFVFTSVLLFGTAAGTITVMLDGLIISLWLQRRHLEFHKLLFNTAAPALSIWIAAEIFFRVTGVQPLSVHSTSISGLLPGLFLFAVAYFLLNSWLMAIVVSFEKSLTPLQVWRENFLWLSLNFFSGASVAILLVSVNREVTLGALALIVPLLIVSYLTYQTAMGRVADANRHVERLNRLYLSTIETLAMAIDAKDQVTHGHIRRVQTYSVDLARHLGVNDEHLIKAIEAASLLHDMGKLAVPEHILNKPGKLTGAEFAVMKIHAGAGADMLAAIEFPYPVVPIVRHHHENWDGTGYPEGLAGTEIPIGARILAVVDCFDALVSDRPYRSKLTDAKAMEILRARRGCMYDPLVVDAFVEMYGRLRSSHEELPTNRSKLKTPVATQIPDVIVPPWSFRKTAPVESRASTVPYSIDVVASYLTRLAPDSLLVLYSVDESVCALRTARVWGRAAPTVIHLQIPLGKRLSGWVAVNRTAVYDADPKLDFVGLFESREFCSCSATPIIIDEELLGVLAIYFRSRASVLNVGERNLGLTCSHMSSYLASYRLTA